MSGFVGKLRSEVLRLQVALYACRERLQAQTDGEALHDLRVCLRRLRSLLKPLKGAASSDSLQQRAAELGRLSGPLRDLEVLIELLRKQGEHAAADRRTVQRRKGDSLVLSSRALPALFQALDEWPYELAVQQASGELDDLESNVRRYLRKQRGKLVDALRDPQHDRHQVRLLIKRVRYTAEAYPHLSPFKADQLRLLKKGQSALGDWHDHLQWLATAEHESDLRKFVPAWRQSMQDAEQSAEMIQARLLAALE
ncbi:CHAD domain-containing protein [Phytopseudomonas punonensis]|uniref:CHAD domain-containing protein n=1 Tax=Phytopseudomonas punonensis TaxID=1220495 RepID=A0A1M7LUD4_9GAMM|nr:CHAD domain-containing protein [Pseudomonas punonensis]SHM81936.1 CHAD domain-containing protein [Pseudomonas punonensis]